MNDSDLKVTELKLSEVEEFLSAPQTIGSKAMEVAARLPMHCPLKQSSSFELESPMDIMSRQIAQIKAELAVVREQLSQLRANTPNAQTNYSTNAKAYFANTKTDFLEEKIRGIS